MQEDSQAGEPFNRESCTSICVQGNTVAQREWKYVGDGRGNYEPAAQYNFVGEGSGDYNRTIVTVPGPYKVRPAVTGIIAMCALAGVLVLAHQFNPGAGGSSDSDSIRASAGPQAGAEPQFNAGSKGSSGAQPNTGAQGEERHYALTFNCDNKDQWDSWGYMQLQYCCEKYAVCKDDQAAAPAPAAAPALSATTATALGAKAGTPTPAEVAAAAAEAAASTAGRAEDDRSAASAAQLMSSTPPLTPPPAPLATPPRAPSTSAGPDLGVAGGSKHPAHEIKQSVGPGEEDEDVQKWCVGEPKEWSLSHKKWCCKRGNIGCDEIPSTEELADAIARAAGAGAAAAAAAASETEAIAPVTSGGEAAAEPHDCNEGYDMWRSKWTAAKKAWCCVHKKRACFAKREPDASV